jgi:hypothetical protein
MIASLAGVAAAGSDDRWIHVRVDDAGSDGGHVDIQVPIGLVSSLLPALSGKHSKGSIHVDGKERDLAELRGYWNAVRAAKDGDYVTVRDGDSDVRVSKSGGVMKVTANDRGGTSRVRMTIPVSLVDAVLASENSIDFGAISGALAKAPLGDLITVDDEDSHVRIWIDNEASAARDGAR